jgi:protein-disulfide isomerase
MTNPDDIKNKAASNRSDAKKSDSSRARNIQIIGGLFVGLFVFVIIGLGVFAKSQSSSDIVIPEQITEYNSAAQLPKGVTAQNGYGVPVGIPNIAAPRAELYEDFQCPACGALEKANSENIISAGVTGQLNLTLHPMIFLDRNFPESKLSSLRSTMAWGCAVDADKNVEYHAGIFTLQSAQEGTGYSDAQLIDLAKKVGISGAQLTEFETCYTSNKYKSWAQNSELHAKDRGVQGTPSFYLKDQFMDAKVLYDPAGFKAAVTEANKK